MMDSIDGFYPSDPGSKAQKKENDNMVAREHSWLAAKIVLEPEDVSVACDEALPGGPVLTVELSLKRLLLVLALARVR